MDVNVLGFLLSFGNLMNLGGPKYQLKDISMKIETVANLKETLNYPGISTDKFRDNSYQRTETFGVYISENLRNYLFKGNVSPDEEGFVLWLFFEPRTDSFETGNDEYYYLISRPGLSEKAAKSFLQYVNNNYRRRRSIFNK